MENIIFSGRKLRLARLASDYSLDELGDIVGVSRQYIHRLETSIDVPNDSLWASLADTLGVQSSFFKPDHSEGLIEDQFHFRSLVATKQQLRQHVMAKGEVLSHVVDYISSYLKLGSISFEPQSKNNLSMNDIEDLAVEYRGKWGLGLGPIDNMVRLLENLGVIVSRFDSSKEIDAFAITSKNPIVMRNNFKESVCRMRFDLAHELGHLVMHSGVSTGDRLTESQANRFAGAFLIPKEMMLKFFPKPRVRFNWKEISEFKLAWKVSKAAILYRARQLDLLTEEQTRSGYIALRRSKESISEIEDHLIPNETPEMLETAMKYLSEKKGVTASKIAHDLGLSVGFLEKNINISFPKEAKRPSLRIV